MNEEAHWNSVAPAYEEEVLNVFHSERDGKLRHYFKKHGSKNKTAIDFGCGIGNGFHYLAPSFGHILAVDISTGCLRQAKARNYKNISFQKANLASPNLSLPHADFILCSNVAILPDVEKDRRIIKNARKTLRKNGSALFIIPSFESILFATWRMIEWYRREGTDPADIPASEWNSFKGRKSEFLQGIVDVGGVPTKHYSQPEIEVLFPESGFNLLSVTRLEYDWRTEFDSPPQWMKEPYPWDWLVECVRKD